jgi:hypothetical protein
MGSPEMNEDSSFSALKHKSKPSPPGSNIPDCTCDKQEVIKAQKEWGDLVVAIGASQNNETLLQLNTNAILDKYGYGTYPVLFKPTKAAPPTNFRLTRLGAESYFIGPYATKQIPGDDGFALQPWTKVEFNNIGIATHNDVLPNGHCQCSFYAMGTYNFYDTENVPSTVEYSWNYKKDMTANGDMLIVLHHSSIPY